MSGLLDRGGTVVVCPSNDKRPTSTNEPEDASSSNSSQSVSKLPRSQTLNLIYCIQYQAALPQSPLSLDALLDSTFGSPPVIPPLPFQLSSSAQPGPPSVPAVEIPTRSCNNNPILNQFMVVPPDDKKPPTLEEGHVSISSKMGDKLPATTGTNLMPTNGATSYFTPKMPGEWS